jgi:reverse gyrase
MANWNNYCPRCQNYVFSRRVAKATPCPRCGQPCVEYGEMKRAQLDYMMGELQRVRDEHERHALGVGRED